MGPHVSAVKYQSQESYSGGSCQVSVHVWSSSTESEGSGRQSGQDRNEVVVQVAVEFSYIRACWAVDGSQFSVCLLSLNLRLIYKVLYMKLVRKPAMRCSLWWDGVEGGSQNADTGQRRPYLQGYCLISLRTSGSGICLKKLTF